MNSSVKTRAQGKPGTSGPAAFAFFCPGPQLGNFTKKISLASNTKPSARPVPTRWSGAEGSDGRFLRSQLSRIGPGRCPQARPCRQRPHPITITSAALAKPELSTLHKIGTFYFALTVATDNVGSRSVGSVRGKGFDTDDQDGRRIWEQVQIRLARPVPVPDESVLVAAQKFGQPQIRLPHLGQGAFRMIVADSYLRQCAVSSSHILHILDAAHIRPYTTEGGNFRCKTSILKIVKPHPEYRRGGQLSSGR